MAKDWFKRLFQIQRPEAALKISPGLYHAMKKAEGMYTRFHLRVERDGHGMLMANAAAAAQLSPTGVVIVKGLLDGKDQASILKDLKDQFKGVNEAVMQSDVAKVQALIEQIVTPEDTYPIYNLEDAAISPYTAELIAPLQAAVPLTMSNTLVTIIDRLWEAGIPHATFLVPTTGDAATDSSASAPWATSLLRAVERAEDLGMIAGVRARATELLLDNLLPDLVQAGIDHVTLPYASTEAALHDALFGAGDHAAAVDTFAWLEANVVCAVAEVPLLATTVMQLDATVADLIDMGADNLSFVAYATIDSEFAAQDDGALTADGMPQVATMVEEAASEAQARFIWNPPVQRNPAKSLAEQVQEGPRCSGDVAIRVEPDGAVIPPRGPYESAGNLIQDAWQDIWNHKVFLVYRERVEAPTRCDVCPGLAICAADCPREPSGWAQEV